MDQSQLAQLRHPGSQTVPSAIGMKIIPPFFPLERGVDDNIADLLEVELDRFCNGFLSALPVSSRHRFRGVRRGTRPTY